MMGISTRDFIGAAVGGLMGWAGTYFIYVTVQKPQLELAQSQLRSTQEGMERMRKDTADRMEKLEKMAKALDFAKDELISHVTEAVNDVRPLPGSPPNKPVQLTKKINDEVLIPKAQHIIDERNRAREGINRIADNLSLIYRSLDSDIDEAEHLLKTQSNDPRMLYETLQRISDSWPTKQQLMEAQMTNILNQFGVRPSTP
jgi:hypothetical protein